MNHAPTLVAALLFSSAAAAAQTASMGLIVGSVHAPLPVGATNQTPGLYLRSGALMAGWYRNSYGSASVFATRDFACGPVRCLVGAATGYAWFPVVPVLGFTQTFGPARFSLTAGRHSVVLTTALEGSL